MRISLAVITVGLAAVVAAGCDRANAPATGAIRVTFTSAGDDLDPNGYSFRVDEGPEHAAASPSGSFTIEGVQVGRRTVSVAGLATNCQLTDPSTRRVTVVADETVDVAFDIKCLLLIGNISVAANTLGANVDADGYAVSVDGGAAEHIDAFGSIAIEGLRVGAHVVTLSGLDENCHVESANPISVTVIFATYAYLGFTVRCTPYTGTIRVTASTTGVDLDPDGYDVAVDVLDEESHVATNGVISIAGVTTGNRSVTLRALNPNCTVNGANPRIVPVAANATTDVTINVTCAAFARMQVSAVSTGADLDPNGYNVRVTTANYDRSSILGVNGSFTFTDMAAGDKVVLLDGVAANCDVSGSNPRTVAATSGNTVDVTFNIACAAATKLAYWKSTGGHAEIYVVSSNGTAETRLTFQTADAVEPSWSPDGSKLVFRSQRDGNAEIYTIDASGSNLVRLTTSTSADYDPAWSPDGTKIAFVSNRAGADAIHVMNADGSNVVQLTNNSNGDVEPAWSPDGSKIVFRRRTNTSSEIYVMNADGSGLTRLTHDAWDGQPDWSPDGTKIAFVRQGSCGYYDACVNNIFVMNADGSGVTQLQSDVDESQPTWSPDGRRIAFVSSSCDYYDCYGVAVMAMKIDGSQRTEIVSGARGNPAWRR